jgi:lipid II:glycine glycyltransferase (peptidoglycan interpeptide bridge formation enzyme)
MITRILYDEEKAAYDKVVVHPIQTWAWGDFQSGEGHKVYRLGVFEDKKIISAYSVSFHRIPKTPYSVGTLLRGPEINDEMLSNVRKIAQEENAIFVKFEPDSISNSSLSFPSLVPSPKVAFYPHSFIVDLTRSESDLLAALSSKTRYNIRLAYRHGVTVSRETHDKGFEIYLKLLFDTTRRQGFYLHSEIYHRHLWETLKGTGLVDIFLASYQGEVLGAFMLFHLKDRLFYPYGASLDTHREVMAPTLLMWECIKYGQSLGLKSFDMWGSLGPDAKEGDQGFGFHRFKEGFGGDLVKFVGTYDLVINQSLYKVYNFVDKYRWLLLRAKAKLFR